MSLPIFQWRGREYVCKFLLFCDSRIFVYRLSASVIGLTISMGLLFESLRYCAVKHNDKLTFCVIVYEFNNFILSFAEYQMVEMNSF